MSSVDSLLKPTMSKPPNFRRSKKYPTNNFVAGLFDFQNEWNMKRYGHSKVLADKWLKQLGGKLKKKVDEKAKLIFMKQIDEGMRLTMKEIINLKDDWKDGYAKVLKEENDQTVQVLGQRREEV